MDEHTTVELLEELAERFGIQIRYEPIKQDEDLVKVVGGLCLLRGEYVLPKLSDFFFFKNDENLLTGP